jgi:hypothetical protein
MGKASRQGSGGKQKSTNVERKTYTLIYPDPIKSPVEYLFITTVTWIFIQKMMA